jgi:hypothetical protein
MTKRNIKLISLLVMGLAVSGLLNFSATARTVYACCF